MGLGSWRERRSTPARATVSAPAGRRMGQALSPELAQFPVQDEPGHRRAAGLVPAPEHEVDPAGILGRGNACGSTAWVIAMVPSVLVSNGSRRRAIRFRRGERGHARRLRVILDLAFSTRLTPMSQLNRITTDSAQCARGDPRGLPLPGSRRHHGVARIRRSADRSPRLDCRLTRFLVDEQRPPGGVCRAYADRYRCAEARYVSYYGYESCRVDPGPRFR